MSKKNREKEWTNKDVVKICVQVLKYYDRKKLKYGEYYAVDKWEILSVMKEYKEGQ